MPLAPSFPDVPPPLPRRFPPARESTVPSAEVPSTRQPIPLTEPLQPEPLPTPLSVPLPSLLGYDAPLFHCHCSPKCIEFVKPRDHPELTWIGTAAQPLRTRVVAAGPVGGRHVKSKTAEFDVDFRVAYEFNDVGFYNELLTALDTNYSALTVTNERSQAFLHRMREKCPAVDITQPRAYKPYYPTQHRGVSYVSRAPLKDARSVAASVVAPTILAASGNPDKRRSIEEIEASLSAQAESVASSLAGSLPVHLRDVNSRVARPASVVVSSDPSDPANNRARLAAERAKFQQEMKDRLLGKMSIASVPATSSSSSSPEV